MKVSTWPGRVYSILSNVVACELGGCRMIWSAATGDASVGCRGCMIDVLIYSVLG